MVTKWANNFKKFYEVGLIGIVALMLSVSLPTSIGAKQIAAVDVQIGAGDQTNSGVTTVDAKAGDTIVIEIFATGWDGVQGLEAEFSFGDISAVEGDPRLTGGPAYPMGLPAVSDNTLKASYAVFGPPPSESGNDLKFIGNATFTLSGSFTALSVKFVQMKFGKTVVPVGTEIFIGDPTAMPKTFRADLNGGSGNQNVLDGRANPGGRFQVQTFAGGLTDVDEVEIRVEVDPAQIDAKATGFIPSSMFKVIPQAASLGNTAPSNFANAQVDIQNVSDGTHTPDGLAVTASGGSTIALEIFGSGYEGANGVSASVRVSDPAAIAGLTSTASPHFSLKLSEPKMDGDLITIQLGNLGAPASAPFQLVSTLNIQLASNFKGLVLEVESVEFAPSGVSGSPNAVLTVTPTGGLQGSLVQVSGNDVILRLNAPVPVSGNVGLGRFVFQTTQSFTQTSLTFQKVSYISAGLPASIEPGLAVSVRSNLSLAPTVSQPPIPVTVLDTQALIRWSTNRAGTGKVIFGTDPANLDQEAASGSRAGRVHLVLLNGLTSGVRYFYKTITTGPSGNASDPFPKKPLIFVTKRRPDTSAPRVVKGPSAVGMTTNSVTILVETDEASNVDILYGTSADDLAQTSSSTDESKLHEFTLTGLTAGGTFFYKAKATDLIGNTATTPQARQFTLRSVVDDSPPRIVGRPTILGSTYNGAVLRWLTTEPSNSLVRFGLTDALGDSSESLELVNEHSVSLSNLLSDTLYFYQVKSIDASANAVTSPKFNFRTRGAEDTTPPRITRPPVIARRSDSEALIVFQTNEPSTVSIQVDSEIEVASDTTGVLGDSFSTSTATKKQEVLLTNLDPATVYFYRIAVTDLTGNGPTYNKGQLSFATLSVADTAPPIVFSRPVALGITEEGASINWKADEPHSAIIRFRVASAAKQAVGDFDDFIEDIELSRRHAVPIAGLKSGTTYEYEVETIDAEGNSSTTANLGFKTRSGADTDAPTIVSGPSITKTTASSATVEWDTDEPSDSRVYWGTSVEYGETIEVAEGIRSHSVTLTDLEAATLYHYAVGSSDATGNTVTTDAKGTTAGLSIDHKFRTLLSEDVAPPVITEGPLVEIRNKLVVVKWRTDEQSTSRVVAGVLPGSADASVENAPIFGKASQIVFDDNVLSKKHSVTVTGLSPGLDYMFQASSTDANGNTISSFDPTTRSKLQPPGGFGSFTTTTVADTQYPVITSGPTVVASTSSSVTVEWGTDESSSGTIDFGTSEADLGSQEVTGTNETTHRLVLTKLAAGTTYAYQIGSTDAVGNGATKSAVVFATTDAGEDLTAPVISGTPSVIYVNDRQATVSWSTSEAADSEVAFGTSADQLLDIRSDSDFNSSHSITLTNLTASTTYYYTASSTDQSNNGPATSAVQEFTTDATPDLSAPSITSDITFAITDSEALIIWSTDELSDSAVRYGLTSGALDFNTGDSKDVLDHGVNLTNLQPATTYTFQVESIDRAGNGPTKGSELSFTTLAQGESAKIDAPTALAATAGNGAVQLSWTASTSTGVLGVVVERKSGDGIFQAIASLENVATYTDNNVENGASYSYQIRAIGLNQVQSDPSTASAAVSPAAGIGPSAPTLAIKQGNPLQPTIVISNSTPLNDGDALNYTFQLSSQADYSDALSLDSGLSEGAGTGPTDPKGLTAWTVTRELDDGLTYYYRVGASDGTFNSEFLTGQITVNASELPFPGDTNGDFLVGFPDFLSLVGAFNKSSSDAGYALEVDFDGDGDVDFPDFISFTGAFGRQYVRGEDASSKPVIIAAYDIDASTRLDLIGRPTSSAAGDKLIVEVHAADAVDMLGLGFRVSYDKEALEYVHAFQGPDALFRSDERSADVFGTLEHNQKKGEVFIAGAVTQGGSVSGEGVVSRLLFVLKTDNPQGNLINLAEGLIIDGEFNVSSAQNLGTRLSLVPENFALEHNFPNPFNPETTIRYAIPEASQVRLIVYNILGQEVTRLVDKNQIPGFYALAWDGKDTFGRGVASGVYIYRIQATGKTQRFSQVHKMLLLK